MEIKKSAVESMVNINSDFWNKKKVFISGNTGFKGSWLSFWLQKMGAEVIGYALPPEKGNNLFKSLNLENSTNCIFGDIRDRDFFLKSIKESDCEIAFHLAAQALVKKSYINPYETYSTNIMGTVNFFDGIKECKHISAAINVTSDKCYENRDEVLSFNEDAPLGGSDPYSNSKGCSELITSCYRDSFFDSKNSSYKDIKLASVRAGNVIGGGDWSSDRLIPDLIINFLKGEKPIIRYPKAVRPWQFVLEPLHGYLVLAEKLFFSKNEDFSGAWNFGSQEENIKTVEWIADYLKSIWPSNVDWELDQSQHPYEASYLSLDCTKAKDKLNWSTRMSIEETLNELMEWYIAFEKGKHIEDLTNKQIDKYLNKF